MHMGSGYRLPSSDMSTRLLPIYVPQEYFFDSVFAFSNGKHEQNRKVLVTILIANAGNTTVFKLYNIHKSN